MKILEFTDPHATRTSEFSQPTEDGLNEYLQLFIKSFEFVCEQVEIHEPDLLAFGGDFWDGRDYVDTMAINVGQRVFNMLNEVASRCHKVAIIGNHDYFSIEHQIHTLTFLRGMGWHVYEKPSIGIYNGVKVGFLPFRDAYTAEELTSINRETPAVVFSHLDVIGGKRRAPRNDKDIRAFSETGVSRELLSNCGMILNGHYHHPSRVSDNWVNVGSLTSRTFHDKDSDPRGIVVYDTESKELLRVENPHARRFVDVNIESEDDLAELLGTDLSNCYARVHYDIELAESVQGLSSFFAGARMVPVARRAVQAAATAVDLRFSLDENLERYIKQEYDDEGLGKLALEILRQAAEARATGTTRQPLDFGWLEIRNFQCFRSARINLHDQGLLFIRGINSDDTGQESNGSGKSTLIEAIYWCLTGESLREYLANEVIHWEESYCSVSLELYVGDKVYTVIRSRKDPEHGTGVKLFVGGESAGARIAADTETKLEDLIGRSETNLRHVCFMTTGLSHRFSALGYAARARLLEDIIDSRPYQDAEELAEARLGETVVKRSKVQGSLEAVNRQKNAAFLEINNLTTLIVEFDATSSDELHRLNNELKSLQDSRVRLDVELVEIDSLLSTADVELDILRKKRQGIDEAYRSIGRDIAGVQSRHAVATSEVTRIGKLLSQALCPTCGTKVDEKHFHGQQTVYKNEATAFEGILSEHKDKYSQLEKRLSQLDDAVNRGISHQRSLQARRKVHAVSIHENTESQNSTKYSLGNFESKRQSLVLKLQLVQTQHTEHEQRWAELDREETELVHLESQLHTLVKEVFNEKGVRNSLLSQVAIPYINAKLPEYAAYLWGGRKIELSGSRELKGGKSKNEIDIVLDGYYTYKGCSSGQRRRLDLAIQFSMNDLAIATGSSRIGFLAIDEVLDHLDEPGIYAAKEVLRQKSELGTILMISHSKYAAAITPRQLVLRRSGLETSIEEQNIAPVME